MPTSATRDRAFRIFVFGGLSLVLIGMLLGEVYAVFVSHVANSQVRRHWMAAMAAIAKHDPSTVEENFSRIEELQQLRGRMANTHSHVTAYGFLAIMLGLLQPLLNLREKMRSWLAILVVTGGLVQALFVFVSAYTGKPAVLLADLGSGMVVVASLVFFMAFVSGANREGFAPSLRSMAQSESARIFLRGGACLVLLGMIFGFYYAWLFVERLEPQQLPLLEAGIRQASAGDLTKAAATVSAYRALQSKMAITAAAHSHVIEYGTLAVLLAFLQPLVALHERWKARWAWTFVVASLAMGICIYNATIFGLVSAGLADTCGVFLIVSLIANLAGLIRRSGAEDAILPPRVQ